MLLLSIATNLCVGDAWRRSEMTKILDDLYFGVLKIFFRVEVFHIRHGNVQSVIRTVIFQVVVDRQF